MLSLPSGRSYCKRTDLLSNCLTAFTRLRPLSWCRVGPPGQAWRYVLLEIQFTAPTKEKHSEVMSKMPIGSSPQQASAILFLTWISDCSEYHFTTLNHEREIFESSNTFWKEASFQNQLGCCCSIYLIMACGLLLYLIFCKWLNEYFAYFAYLVLHIFAYYCASMHTSELQILQIFELHILHTYTLWI